MQYRRHRFASVAGIAMTVVAITACSGSPAGSAVASSRPSATNPGSPSAVAATSAPSVGASAAVPASLSPAPALGPPGAVDLAFTGTLVFVAKGTGGSCTPGTGSDGAVTFGFEASDVDFPGLGSSFSASESSRDDVGIKWIVDPNRVFGNTDATKIALSADHHSIQLDTDLGGPGPEHVKGTITCP